MKNLFFIAALSAALMATPTMAQQGPAGIPGAPGLAPTTQATPAVTTTAPIPQEQAQAHKRGPVDCNTVKNVAQCKARQEARQKIFQACKDKSGIERKQCLRDQLQNVDCSKMRNQQQCESRKQAFIECKDQNGPQFKQCMQQRMPATDCSKARDPARCEQHAKARELCQNKQGQEHLQCLRDNLSPNK